MLRQGQLYTTGAFLSVDSYTTVCNRTPPICDELVRDGSEISFLGLSHWDLGIHVKTIMNNTVAPFVLIFIFIVTSKSELSYVYWTFYTLLGVFSSSLVKFFFMPFSYQAVHTDLLNIVLLGHIHPFMLKCFFLVF